MKRKTNSSGEVTFKKPGRMRWDYEKPDKSSYITDGGVLWLYEPDDKQAFKQDLEGVAAAGRAGVPDRQGQARVRVRHHLRRQDRPDGGAAATTCCRCRRRRRRRRSRASCSSSIRTTVRCARACIIDAKGNINDHRVLRRRDELTRAGGAVPLHAARGHARDRHRRSSGSSGPLSLTLSRSRERGESTESLARSRGRSHAGRSGPLEAPVSRRRRPAVGVNWNAVVFGFSLEPSTSG